MKHVAAEMNAVIKAKTHFSLFTHDFLSSCFKSEITSLAFPSKTVKPITHPELLQLALCKSEHSPAISPFLHNLPESQVLHPRVPLERKLNLMLSIKKKKNVIANKQIVNSENSPFITHVKKKIPYFLRLIWYS